MLPMISCVGCSRKFELLSSLLHHNTSCRKLSPPDALIDELAFYALMFRGEDAFIKFGATLALRAFKISLGEDIHDSVNKRLKEFGDQN